MADTPVTVKVHYTGRLEDGKIFDSSEGRDPLEFQLGSGMVIPGFDKGVAALKVGESTTITIPAEEAYGMHDDSLIQKASVSEIPNGESLPVGERVVFQTEHGPLPALVKSIEDGIVTFDFNHELAGKTLIFDLTLVERSDSLII